MKSIRINQRIAKGIAFCLFTLLILLLIPSQVPIYEEVNPASNGRSFPYFLTVVMGIAGLGEIVVGLVSKKKEYYTISKELFTRWRIPLLMLGTVFIYCIIIPYIGFLLASILMCVGTLLFLRCKKWHPRSQP